MERAINTDIATTHRVCGSFEYSKSRDNDVAYFHDNICRRDFELRLGVRDECESSVNIGSNVGIKQYLYTCSKSIRPYLL